MADLCEYNAACSLVKFLAFAAALFPLVTFCIGLVNLETSCPIEPKIPMYITVCSAISIAYQVVCFIQVKYSRDDNKVNFILWALVWFLALGYLACAIAGVVLFGFTATKRSDDTLSPNFCNHKVYQCFSFQVFFSCVQLAFLIFCVSCLCCLPTSPESNSERQRFAQPSGHGSGGNHCYSADKTHDGGMPDGANMRTVRVQRDRFAIIRRGPNLYYMYQSAQITTVEV